MSAKIIFESMLKILSSDQIKELDATTIKVEGISSLDLMERAATQCSNWVQNNYAPSVSIYFFAGIGNNGGDALVMARLLAAKGYDCHVFVVCISSSRTTDFSANYERLKGMKTTEIRAYSDIPELPNNGLVIDGIFGTGITRPVDGIAQKCIEAINNSCAEVVSIDLPSGLLVNSETPASSTIIRANHTLTFQLPKLSFMLPDKRNPVGEVHILDIALDKKSLNEMYTDYFYVNDVREYSESFKRSKFDHKGMFGHALVIAGSRGMMGAAVLSNTAALKSGAGRVTAHIPSCGYSILQSAVPEVMCNIDLAENHFSDIEVNELKKFNALAIGPGLGKSPESLVALKKVLKASEQSWVIDADALNLLADEKGGVDLVPRGSILTPHIGEFERLFGRSDNEFDRLGRLKEMAQTKGLFIILKGRHSALATPEGKVYFNSSGTPGMATAGSGDVLTGIIVGLLAQCNDPFVATLCGMYIHGVAGEMASKIKSIQGMIASDMIDQMGNSLQASFIQ